MKSYDRNFYDLLTQVGQTYIIPSFQRDYSWELSQWEVLWRDIKYLLANPDKFHYTGSLVYIPSETHASYLREVIDGQQRLTTISIIYLVLYDLLRTQKLGNYSPDRLRVQVLANEYNDIETERLKLRPAGNDGEIYKKLIDSQQDSLTPTEKKSNLYRCYQYFLDQLQSELIEVQDLIDAVRRLQVIEIVLNQNDDHPQKVFESINSTGKQLNVGDLIRNYVLMRGTHEDREKLYHNYWVGIEDSLKKDDKSLLEEFFATYIRIKKEQPVLNRLLYESFKSIYDAEENVEAFLKEIKLYVDIYEFMKYDSGVYPEKLKPFRYSYDVLNFLKIDVLDTFLMPVLRDFILGPIPEESAVRIHEFIINYLSRRLIVNKPTTSLNKYAPKLYSKLKEYDSNKIDDTLVYELTENTTAQLAYPSNTEVEQGILSEDFYSRKDACRYVLLSIENSNLDSRFRNLRNDQSLTIEHVMPQKLSSIWEKSLGPNCSEIHNKYLNTLANLTLTAYNSKYSNKPFSEKLRNSEGTGLAESPLYINQIFKSVRSWGEEEIIQRQKDLMQRLLKIFPPCKAVNKYDDPVVQDFYPINKIGDPTGQKPDAYIAFGQKFSVESWQQLYIDIIKTLSELSDIDDVVNIIHSWPSGKAWISKDRWQLRVSKPLSYGYYVECNRSAKGLVETIIGLIEELDGVDHTDIKVKLK